MAAGILLPVDQRDARAPYRLATTSSAPDDVVPPSDEREHAAVLRVLHHLLAHLLGVKQRLSPDTYRSPDLSEPAGEPAFADDLTAIGWFTAEIRKVLAAQRLTEALGEDLLVLRFGEVTWTASILTEHPQDVLAIQTAAAEAGQRLGHTAAGTARARASARRSGVGCRRAAGPGA